MRFHINHVWTNAPLLAQVSDPQWKAAASRSNFCLIPAFHLGGAVTHCEETVPRLSGVEQQW